MNQGLSVSNFLSELSHCELCEHRCQVNRLNGETGVCKVTLPTVASATLHPAPPGKLYGIYGRLQL